MPCRRCDQWRSVTKGVILDAYRDRCDDPWHRARSQEGQTEGRARLMFASGGEFWSMGYRFWVSMFWDLWQRPLASVGILAIVILGVKLLGPPWKRATDRMERASAERSARRATARRNLPPVRRPTPPVDGLTAQQLARAIRVGEDRVAGSRPNGAGQAHDPERGIDHRAFSSDRLVGAIMQSRSAVVVMLWAIVAKDRIFLCVAIVGDCDRH